MNTVTLGMTADELHILHQRRYFDHIVGTLTRRFDELDNTTERSRICSLLIGQLLAAEVTA